MRFSHPPHDRSITICTPGQKQWYRPTSPWKWGISPHFYAQTPLAGPIPYPLVLHYQLIYPQNPSAAPEILWDVIHPPAFARVSSDRQFFKKWRPPDFDTEALQPTGIKKVWILSDHIVLAHWVERWGPIIVISSKSLTIRDILEGIYAYFRTPLTSDDLHHVNSIPDNRRCLSYAHAQRAKDSYEIEAVVISQGYRRVDVVGGHRKFHGLRISILPDQTWRLYMNLTPGTVPRVS